MADKLKEYDWSSKPRGGRKSKYDWDTLLDGSVWRLRNPEDFSAKPENFLTNVKTAARKAKKQVRTVKEDDSTVVVQAIL